MSRIAIGDRVVTLHGNGEVVNIEHFSRIDGGTNRYGVKLDKSPFSFDVAGYWPNEITASSLADE